MQHFNGLTEGEAERLAILIEEAAEVQQIACKILRHGYDSQDPTDANCPGNRALLEKELGHVAFAVRLLLSRNDVRETAVSGAMHEKKAKIGQYLHHNTADFSL